MSLYYHRTSGQTAEDMISAKTGKPYMKMRTAFAYRKAFNPTCRCNYGLLDRSAVQPDQDGIQPSNAVEPASETEQVLIPLPKSRPDRGQDPETLSMQAGKLTLDQFSALSHARQENGKQVARRVRIIGEEFFPSQ